VNRVAATSILPHETRISGNWIPTDQGLIEDENCKRISKLINGHLIEVGRDASGWNTLYRDPFDDRFWELTYPCSDRHGGGPPVLQHVAKPDRVEQPNS
jgi:Immunity protein 27